MTGSIAAPKLLNTVTDSGVSVVGILDGDILIDGNVNAPISVGSMASSRGISITGNLSANITATAGSLGDISMTTGSMFTGTIGTSLNPVVVSAAGSIGGIKALGVYGSVSANGASSGIGPVSVLGPWVGSMDVDSVSSFSVGGWEGGTAKIRTLVPTSVTLEIGNVSGTATVNLPGGLAGTLRIANTMVGSIALPTGGLPGQIIINAGNAISTSPWTGTVSVGSTSLSPTPSYAQFSSQIGGGAVGVVPFALHSADSTPPSNTPTNNTISTIRAIPGGGAVATPDSQIIITSYGPVARTVSTSPIVNIELQNGATWVDANASFTVEMNPSAAGARASRSIGIRAVTTGTPLPTPAAGLYRVTPTSNLVCGGLSLSTPPAVAWPSYFFRIACAGDFNLSGLRDVNDIFAFLSAWFARLPSSDYNGNSVPTASNTATDVNDIFAFLAAWFSGCPNQAPPTAAELATTANQIYAIDPVTGELYESLSLAPLPVLIDSVQSFLTGQPDDASKAAVQAAINDENVTPGMIFTALCASYGTTCELVPTGP